MAGLIFIEGTASVGYHDKDGWCIPSSSGEWAAIEALYAYRRKLAKKGITLPVYVFLSLVGVRGHYLAISGRSFERMRRLYRSDAMLLPEVVITDSQQTDEEVLRPVFDRIWNAFGYERSFSFDAAGKYAGERY